TQELEHKVLQKIWMDYSVSEGYQQTGVQTSLPRPSLHFSAICIDRLVVTISVSYFSKKGLKSQWMGSGFKCVM
ncbi:hypothetical protein, partial [Solemya velum gill symbiont]|uniref:hypothetical protein n=1 Tax=Solemya velum gill symbiont TaxID=2340 RepID=UPI001E368CC0